MNQTRSLVDRKYTSWLVLLTWFFSAVESDSAAQQVRQEVLQIEDFRPIARAVYELRLRHGLVITYEDPIYIHESEVLDVTEDFPEAKRLFEKAQGPRLIAPGRGRLDLTYSVTQGVPRDPAALLQDLLADHAGEGNPGRFRLLEKSHAFHVIPVSALDEDGKLTVQQPLMDHRISLVRGEQSADQALRDFTAALEDVAGTEIMIGIRPARLEADTVEVWADDEPARDVLWRVLNSGSDTYTWGLYYDPTDRSWMLNVSLVGKRDSSVSRRTLLVEPRSAFR